MSDFFDLFAKFNSEFMGLLFFLMLTFLSALVFYFIYFRKNLSPGAHEVPESLVKNYANNRSFPQELGDLNGADLLSEITRLRRELSVKNSEQDSRGGVSDNLIHENQELKRQIETLKGKLSLSSDSTSLKELKDENNELGLKLKEYEIIENDLANLKQIQDENTRLKELIRGKDLEAEFQDDFVKIAGKEDREENHSVNIAGVDEIVQEKVNEKDISEKDQVQEEVTSFEEQNSVPEEDTKDIDSINLSSEETEEENGQENLVEAKTSSDKEKTSDAEIVDLDKDGVEKSADELLSEFEKMLG